MAILRLENVSKEYRTERDTVRALDGVSLSVGEGEFVSLVGRSGCGKSTLLNVSGAMDFPTSGRVFFDGSETTRLDDRALTAVRRTKIGFVFQFFQLLPTLSVLENVELPLLLQGDTNGRDRAFERLRWVEMDGFADRLAHQLSGGQMQRVAIARALVTSPRMILADEPIGNLDSSSAEIVMQLLRRASSDLKTTVLMATHSLEAAAVSDTIVRLRDGQIEEISRN